MIEMTLILDSTWHDNQVTGEDVLVRVSVPDQQVILTCLSDDNKQVIIDFAEIEAIQRLIKSSERAWRASHNPDSPIAAE